MARRTSCVLFAVGIVALLPGCVERRFRVESNPPGAAVYVNNIPYGPTPVDIPFLYYGKYDITLFKDGFQTRTIKQEVSTPWYQYAPLDLLSENVWPLQITDIRPLCYDLEPYAQPNLDQIKADAEELRRRGMALPPPRFPGLEDKPRPAPAPRPGEPPPLPAPRDLNDLPPLLPPPGF